MTDLLNAAPEVHLGETQLVSLEDGHSVDVPELTVGRDELCAVVAAGPRGDPARRLKTYATRVEADLGPYHVEGAIHSTPASDPLASVVRRAAWVPLTEVILRYSSGTDTVREEVETLIVNRGLATAFQAVEIATPTLPWEKPRTAPSPARRTVDMTGTLRDEELAEDDSPRFRAPEAPV